jgi:uncharacterized protein YidB (DUF937 family)
VAVSRKLRVFFVLAVVVALLSALIAGIALAQNGEGDGTRRGFAGRVASRLGVTEEELRGAVKGAGLDIVDEAVAEGRMSAERGERLREQIEEGSFGRLAGLGRLLRSAVDAVSDTLDMTPREILGELRDGQSLAELAEAQGVPREELKAVITTEVQGTLDQAVAEGRLTQERADEIMARLNENIDKVLDWERGEGFSSKGTTDSRRSGAHSPLLEPQ